MLSGLSSAATSKAAHFIPVPLKTNLKWTPGGQLVAKFCCEGSTLKIQRQKGQLLMILWMSRASREVVRKPPISIAKITCVFGRTLMTRKIKQHHSEGKTAYPSFQSNTPIEHKFDCATNAMFRNARGDKYENGPFPIYRRVCSSADT
jgi:hypothetical protein